MLFQTTPERCFINAPFLDLENGLLDLFVRHGLQPEIGLEGNLLYNHDLADFQKVADILASHDLCCTIHAPFFDLAPGALDPYIRAATRDKLRQAFKLIEIFQPKAVVCHLNFEENKHGYKLQEWSSHALETWRPLVEYAARASIPVMLENTYERSPERHQDMLRLLDSPFARFCLDVGHLMAFAHSPWQQWLPTMAPWLGHLHLHDNHGGLDEHLAIGHGNFDFTGLFNYLAVNQLAPLITLEPHSEADLWASLDTLAKSGVVRLGKESSA